jgi:hypothetical protein
MVAMRQQIKNDFLKSLPGAKTCKNCKGYEIGPPLSPQYNFGLEELGFFTREWQILYNGADPNVISSFLRCLFFI